MQKKLGTFDTTWESIHRERSWGRYPSEFVVRSILGTVAPNYTSSPLHALDIGAGQGATTWFLLREGMSVTAIDGSASAIRKLRKRMKAEGIEEKCETAILDFTLGLPFNDGSFDVAIDNCSLYANPLPAIRSTLDESYRVLRPGGWFIGCGFTADTSASASPLGRIPVNSFFTKMSRGPLANTGAVQFLSKRVITSLFSKFSHVEIDTAMETRSNASSVISWWRVVARK